MSFRACIALLLVLRVLAGETEAAELIGIESEWRWKRGLAEASAPDPTAWRLPDFDDSAWETGAAPFYYGERLFGTWLADMQGNYTGVYLRCAFTVEDPAEFSRVELQALSDDGFAAWLNGVPVARFNVPDGEIPYSGTALGALSEPLPLESYEIPAFREILVRGTNVLAVHALNSSLSASSDFVFVLWMMAEIDETPPVVSSLLPPAESHVRELTRITVTFSKPVDGVDAADLLLNGVAATNVTGFGGDRYVFEFAPQEPGTVSVDWAPDAAITDLAPRRNVFEPKGWTYTVNPDLPPPGVALNEFMADNNDTLNDEDGDASDWIELSNTADEPVSLAGWHLTDDPSNLSRWTFPNVSVPPREFLVVFASGKDRRNPTAPLHTNFRLNRSSGYLALVRPDGGIASEIAAYPVQYEDVSYGRMPTDPTRLGYFEVPTPGAVNAEGGAGFSPPVSFSVAGGTFRGAFDLELTAGGEGTVIRYTLDGSVPTEASPQYTAPLTITDSTRVRARAYSPGLLPGPVSAEYYIALNPTAATASSTLPLVLIHSFGGGPVPPDGEYTAFISIHEPRGGMSSLTNAPDLRARAKLNIRGSSTLYQPKSNYSVEFRDERDADLDLSPVGLPAESDWVLYAPNNFEPILIHNPLAYRLSERIGRYAPRTRFVEVYVQTGTGPVSASNYRGIYVLVEKIKRGSNRVDVDKLEPEHVNPPEVTGGYILKIDRLDPGDRGLHAGGQVMGFVDPKEEEMETPQREPQREYIRQYIDDFWNALHSANWRDPERGWRAYVDVPSWIDHHILNVLAFNVDALRLSTFFHKPRGGKLTFGPVWDFDRALASTDGRDANPRVWRSTVGDRGTDFFNYPWWGRMFEDPDFWQAWIDRYQELRRREFSTNSLFGLIDELVETVRPAQPREEARWPGFTTPRGSYEGEVTRLKRWLRDRLEFMDTNFLAAPVFSLPEGQVSEGAVVTMSGPPGATIYYTLDGTDPRAPGGGVATTARTYSGPVAVGTGAFVRARSRNLAHRNLTGPDRPPISSPWSGLTEARYSLEPPAGPGSVRISEIHYRPSPPTTAELAAMPGVVRSDFEFVELVNAGARAVDITSLRFDAGIQFDFGGSAIRVLAPGERLVVVRNPDAFRLRHGTDVPVAGTFAGGLSSTGETLRIRNRAGEVVAEASYSNAWYPSTDGHGFSLVAVEAAIPFSGPDAWRAGTIRGGSPGAPDPAVESPRVVINEILANPARGQADGVELLNLSPAPADIGGWFLTDDRGNPRRYRIPDGTVLQPGELLWIGESQFGAGAGGFGLSAAGEEVWLFAANAVGELTGYAHGFEFGGSPEGVSFGREELCDGSERLLLQAAVTPGAPNAGRVAPAVVISEIHYHPPDIRSGADAWDDTALEFIELVNVTGDEVELHDPADLANVWRLSGGSVEFAFPPGRVLGAGETAVIVPFDPVASAVAAEAFRRAFSIPESTTLFGPWRGSLPNSSGRITLERPVGPRSAGGPLPAHVVVDSVTYGDRRPWPAAADGSGASLQRLEFAGIGDHPAAWVAREPSPGRLPDPEGDSDGDGMPDLWEIANCLLPGDPSDALADADGDGAANFDEYIARTDPRDPHDVFRWQGISVDPSGVSLRLDVRPGVRYRVECRDDAASGEWRLVREISPSAQPGMMTVSDPAPAAGARFYRVIASP